MVYIVPGTNALEGIGLHMLAAIKLLVVPFPETVSFYDLCTLWLTSTSGVPLPGRGTPPNLRSLPRQ